MDNTQDIEKVRETLKKIWVECSFGVKEKVKKKHSHRVVQYMIAEKNYTKKDKMLEVIKTIEEEINNVQSDVLKMKNKVNKLIN